MPMIVAYDGSRSYGPSLLIYLNLRGPILYSSNNSGGVWNLRWWHCCEHLWHGSRPVWCLLEYHQVLFTFDWAGIQTMLDIN